MKSYVVVGMGRFGSEVARQLYASGCDVLAIDTDETMIQQISNDVTQAVVANAQDKDVLKALGVKDVDCAIIAIGANLAASVLCTMNMKELGVPYIVCKVHDETHRSVLEKLGADRTVIPEKEIAVRLAKSLSAPNVLDYIELSDDFGIVEVPAPQSWMEKSLKELNVRANYGINVIAIKHDGRINAFPGADYRFVPGDVLVVLGDSKMVSLVQKL
jgi:trk system potassium uptake protein TrkA